MPRNGNMLDYSPRPRKRRRPILWSAALVVAAVAVYCLQQFGPIMYTWCVVEVLVYRACDYEPAPNQIAWRKLDGAPLLLKATPPTTSSPEFIQRFTGPRPDGYYNAVDNAGRHLSFWMDLLRIAVPNAKPEATLFLHAMTSPGGHRRLVSVGVQKFPYLIQTVIDVSDWKSPKLVNRAFLAEEEVPPPPRGVPAFGAGVEACLNLVYTQRLGAVFYVGHIDPTDSSRFVIPFRIDGSDLCIDGRLDDQDVVWTKVPGGVEKYKQIEEEEPKN